MHDAPLQPLVSVRELLWRETVDSLSHVRVEVVANVVITEA